MKKTGGFSLLELMIVIAVIAIAIAWAIPSYEDSVRKAKRREAQSLMREFEVCAARSFTVKSDFSEAASCLPPDDENYEYDVDIDTGYLITATPKGDQEKDSCGEKTNQTMIIDEMTMNEKGETTPTPDGCW